MKEGTHRLALLNNIESDIELVYNDLTGQILTLKHVVSSFEKKSK